MEAQEQPDVVTVVRTVAATPEAVWRAWTDAALVRRWWGPTGFTCPRADMDVRIGGTSHVTMQGPPEYGGMTFHNRWSYTALQYPTRLEFTSTFANEHGTVIDPTDAGAPGSLPREVPHVVTIRDLGNGSAEIEVVESGYTDEQVRMISQAGQEQCMDKLATLLEDGVRRSGDQS